MKECKQANFVNVTYTDKNKTLERSNQKYNNEVYKDSIKAISETKESNYNSNTDSSLDQISKYKLKISNEFIINDPLDHKGEVDVKINEFETITKVDKITINSMFDLHKNSSQHTSRNTKSR